MIKVYEFYEKLFDEGWAYKELWDLDPFVTGQTASARGQSDMLATIKNSAAEDFEYVMGQYRCRMEPREANSIHMDL